MSRASIVVGPDGAELRRQVGPCAWCVLEVLTASAQPTAAGLIADASVRTIAADLDIAKGTAHRALTALRRAGLVTALQDRDPTGRYAPGTYRITAPATAITLPSSAPADLAAPSANETRRRAPRRDTAHAAAQLALLEPA
jgi:DNA-binding IclR family transcriptional regulator